MLPSRFPGRLAARSLLRVCDFALEFGQPTEGLAALIFSDPSVAKNDATFAALWLHQAAV